MLTVMQDMKYHPMDRVTRPNSAATRRQSKSASLAMSEAEDEDDSATIDSDEDLSGETFHDELSENAQDEAGPRRAIQTFVIEPRLPDPKASRHSAREAARKAVNYSNKYHPQDHGIPGYRHRPILTQADRQDSVAPSNLKKRPAPITNEVEAPEESEDEQAEVARGKPRKKLKSLEEEPPSRTKKKRGGQRAATKVKTKAKSANKSAFRAKEAEEIDDLVNMVRLQNLHSWLPLITFRQSRQHRWANLSLSAATMTPTARGRLGWQPVTTKIP